MPFCKRACLTEEIRELADIVSRHGAVADHGVDLLAELAVSLWVLEDKVGGEREHPWNAISLMAAPLGESQRLLAGSGFVTWFRREISVCVECIYVFRSTYQR